MSPVRHEDDFRRKPIVDWDTYIEDAITQAHNRGEFDNLPDAGKPIRIQTNPHAPELDFAFSRLKNAGYVPAWMELDQQIKAAQEQLRTFLDDSRDYIRHHAERIRQRAPGQVTSKTAPTPPRRSLWQRLLHGSAHQSPAPSATEPETLDDLRHLIDRMRNQYLQRSAELDKRIGEFNNTLSRDLWHLERMRLTPDRAAKRFDEGFAELISDLNPDR
jgi:hypothetical protein